jgi:hypothetical protein
MRKHCDPPSSPGRQNEKPTRSTCPVLPASSSASKSETLLGSRSVRRRAWSRLSTGFRRNGRLVLIGRSAVRTSLVRVGLRHSAEGARGVFRAGRLDDSRVSPAPWGRIRSGIATNSGHAAKGTRARQPRRAR